MRSADSFRAPALERGRGVFLSAQRRRLQALLSQAAQALGPIAPEDGENAKRPDPLDEVLRIQRNILTDSLRDKQRGRYLEIQAALDRLDVGDYGLCEECEESIPQRRLELVPEARFCVRCGEEQELRAEMAQRAAKEGNGRQRLERARARALRLLDKRGRSCEY